MKQEIKIQSEKVKRKFIQIGKTKIIRLQYLGSAGSEINGSLILGHLMGYQLVDFRMKVCFINAIEVKDTREIQLIIKEILKQYKAYQIFGYKRCGFVWKSEFGECGVTQFFHLDARNVDYR